MNIDEPLPGGKKIVINFTENIGITESPILKQLSEKDPILKDLLELDRDIQERVKKREAERNDKFESLQQRIKKILRET